MNLEAAVLRTGAAVGVAEDAVVELVETTVAGARGRLPPSYEQENKSG